MIQDFLIYGISSLVLSLVLVGVVRWLAKKYQLVVPPRPDRWHQKPTAKFGGIGFVSAYLVVFLVALFQKGLNFSDPFMISLFFGGLGSAVLGFLDDVYHFRAASKLIGQIALVSLYIFLGGMFKVTSWPLINTLLTYFWFIGIMNAVNFLDNMDGLASGVVVILGMVLLGLMVSSGPSNGFLLLVTCVFTTTILGFWLFNRYPASIFMGDTGSLFLGYTLAALSISQSFRHVDVGTGYSSVLALLIPVTVLAIPIFDTTLVTIARALSGRPVTLGGRDHSSHRLVGLGFSEKMSVIILYTLTLVGGVIAILMSMFPQTSMFLFGAYSTFLVVIGLYLGKKKIHSYETTEAKKPGWTPLVSTIMYKKGMAEVVLDMLLVALAYSFAIILQGVNDAPSVKVVLQPPLPIVIILTIITFRLAGIYKGIWNLISIEDIYSFSKATLAATAIVTLTNVAIGGPILWKFYLTFGLLLFVLLVGSRLSFRLFDTLIGTYGLSKRSTRILLYGAGTAGKLLLDEIKRNETHANIRPVGFLDDNPDLVGRHVSGIKILGEPKSVSALFKDSSYDVKEVWISSVNIPSQKMEKLKSLLPPHVEIKRLLLHVVPIGTPLETSIQSPPQRHLKKI